MELKEENERCGSVFILLVALGEEAIVLVRVGDWGDTVSVGSGHERKICGIHKR